MPTSRLSIAGDIGGASIAATILRAASGQINHDVQLPAAKAGTLTTRVGPNEGTITLSSGHGIASEQIVDLYWDGGRKRNAVVGTVSGNDVPVIGDDGDALPDQDTAIRVAPQLIIDTDFVGNLVEMIGALCSRRGRLQFDEESAQALNVDLVANEPWFWASGGTATNPLADKVVVGCIASQDHTVATSLKLGVLYNSDQ
jgi:hypothetical protein